MLGIKEMRLILFGGCLRNVANLYQYSLLGATANLIKYKNYSFAPFYFGQIAGTTLAGLSNDFLFQNCQTLVVNVMNIFSILWNFWDIIYPNHNTDYIEWSLALFGVSNGFLDMYLMILLPMTIADKNRV